MPARRATYLVGPHADVWLLGGASLVAWTLLSLFSDHRDYYGIKNHFGELAVTMASLSVFVNYPHFLASYKLAYGRGWGFIRRHWFQTLMVPCLLIDYLVYAFYLIQLDAPGSQEQSRWLLGLSLQLMYFSVGWHYTKQAFGCTMVYAAYQRYPLSRWQRELVRWCLLSVWWYSFTYGVLQPTGVFFGLTYNNPHLPYGSIETAAYLCAALTCAVIYGVVWRNWRRHGHLPSATLAVPFVAMLIWFAPCFRQLDYFFYVVPFFHSLQYLAFVYRLEKVRAGNNGRALGSVVVGLLVTGWLAFEFIPGNLDKTFDNERTLGMSYFLLAFNVFINVHHYFLDNVLWRMRDDAVVREALLQHHD